jgi:hypothetical protein
MRVDTVVGYTYKADIYCTDCMEEIASNEVERLDPDRVVFPIGEDIVRLWAQKAGIDYINESSYDSDDFPKVVFASEVRNAYHYPTSDDGTGGETADRCGKCGNVLADC